MPVTTVVRTSDPARRDQQRALSDRVVSFFRLPQVPLLIFLDGKVCIEVRNAIGPENRGLFTPINIQAIRELPWPSYVVQEIRKPSGFAFEFPFIGMVYVHGDVCDNELALAMTLAHELQHFLQYSTEQKTWAWNKILTQCVGLMESEGLSWCDVPTELEARIVAKRVHHDIFGARETEQYILARQEGAILPRDADDWKFIQGLDPHMSFDCALGTRLLFQRLCKKDSYRSEITGALRRSRGYPAFDCLILDELLDESKI